jgi:hypothetical protein
MRRKIGCNRNFRNLEFTHIFTTNFVGSLDIRASREVFPIGVRSPEINHNTCLNRSFLLNKDSCCEHHFYIRAFVKFQH